MSYGVIGMSYGVIGMSYGVIGMSYGVIGMSYGVIGMSLHILYHGICFLFAVTFISGILMFLLFVSELNYYLTTEVSYAHHQE
jgi:hypothetical protein